MKVKNSFVISIAPGKYPSTILIPEKWQDLYYCRVREFGTCKFYFSFLIGKYSNQIKKIKQQHYSAYTRKYQEKGQDLIRVNFRPCRSDWTRLRLLAAMWGVSMAFMFVMLMLLDLEDGDASDCRKCVGAPTHSISLTANFSYPSFLYTIKLRSRPPKTSSPPSRA